MNDCPFCRKSRSDDIVAHTKLSLAFLDSFPVNEGHCLIVPRRHVASFFDMTTAEQLDLFSLLPRVKEFIERHHIPSAYNIGINIGEAAGQTVDHAHLHVIPRYAGDVEDPRGGIRRILPDKACYWER